MYYLLYFVCRPLQFRLFGHIPLGLPSVGGSGALLEQKKLEDRPLKRPWSSRPPPGVWDPSRTAAKAVWTQGAGGKPGPRGTPCSRPARSRSGVSRLARTAGRCNPEDTCNGRFSRTCRHFGNAGARRRTPGLWHWEGEGQQKTHRLHPNKYEHFYDYIELYPEISHIHLALKIDRNSRYEVQGRYWLKM